MNVQEAIKIVAGKYPDRVVEEAYEDKGLYLIVAPHKNSKGPDFSDPYFLLNSQNGKCTPFIPSESFELYSNMTDPKKRVYSKE